MRKPKRIFKIRKRNFNPFGTMMVLNTMTTAVQIGIIGAQPGPKETKVIAMIETMQNFVQATKKATKASMLFRFKTTGRYVRNKPRNKPRNRK